MDNNMFSKIWLGLAVLMICVLASCGSSKNSHVSYKDYEGRPTQFSQKKYKISKDGPPIQRYYSKGTLFKPAPKK